MTGRKTIYEKPMRRHCIYLDDQTISMAKELGNGNASAGLRLAVKLCLGPEPAGRLTHQSTKENP